MSRLVGKLLESNALYNQCENYDIAPAEVVVRLIGFNLSISFLLTISKTKSPHVKKLALVVRDSPAHVG